MANISVSGSKVGIVAALALALSCARGSLTEDRDETLNIFGLSPFLADAADGGILGRVVDVNGDPIKGAKVSVRGDQKFFTTTNNKGGFFVGGLGPGSHELTVFSEQGVGSSFAFQTEAGVVTREPEILVQPLARVNGTVETKEPTHCCVHVYAAGTPFDATTDDEGHFFIDLPVGTYDFRAEHPLYQAVVLPHVAVDGDRDFDPIAMEPLPLPAGTVTPINDDPFVVRGNEVRLRVRTTPGVRKMRVRIVTATLSGDATVSEAGGESDSGEDGRSARASAGAWRDVESEITVTAEPDSHVSAVFDFRDAFGNISDLVHVPLYFTDLDRTWQIVYGVKDEKLVVHSGAKVAFVQKSSAEGASDGALALNPLHPVPAAAVFVGDGPELLGGLTVAAGAQLRGSARVMGDLRVEGSKAAPVVWSQAGQVSFHGGSGAISYLQFTEGTLQIMGRTQTRVAVADSVFTNATLRQIRPLWGPGHQSGAVTLVVDHTRFVDSVVDQFCFFGGSADAPGGDSRRSPLEEVIIGLDAVALQRSRVHFGCVNEAGFGVKVAFNEVNFGDLATYAPYYFYSGESTGLPTPQQVQYELKNLYIEVPEKLFPPDFDQTWPAFFPPNAEAPFTGVGPR